MVDTMVDIMVDTGQIPPVFFGQKSRAASSDSIHPGGMAAHGRTAAAVTSKC